MTRSTALSALLFAACGPAIPRPDVCTPQELAWTLDDGCFFNGSADFVSKDPQTCGLPFTETSEWFCHTTRHFGPDTVAWLEVDYGQSVPYECDGNTLTFEREDIRVTWDATAEVLVWNGVEYLPMCPESSP